MRLTANDQIELIGRPGNGAIEQLWTLANLIPDGIAPRPAPLTSRRGNGDQALRRANWQRPQQQRVDKRKDRGVCADAERDRQNRDGTDDGCGDE